MTEERIQELRRQSHNKLIQKRGGLIERLKTVPHLRLHRNIDAKTLAAMLPELAAVVEYIPQQLNSHTALQKGEQGYYHEKWHVRNLIFYNEDSRDARETGSFKVTDLEFDKETGAKCQKVTDLGLKMPLTIQTLMSFGRPDRSRLSKIYSGCETRWHTHCQKTEYADGRPYTFVILHIPLISNPHVHYEVGYVGCHGSQDPVWRAQYSPGEIWVLNGWHDHRAVNYGSDDRVSIFTYFSLENEPLVMLLEEALDKYSGPYIK